MCVHAGWLAEGTERLSWDDLEKVQHTFTEVTMTLLSLRASAQQDGHAAPLWSLLPQ